MTRSLKIVIADDEELLVEELCMYMQEAGHHVVATAQTGCELVEAAAAQGPDLIVTDIKMPDMDGLQAVKKICADRPIPVIIISAYHDEEYIAEAKQQCVMSYLVKPISEANLKAAIALAIKRFDEFEMLLAENKDLRQTLADRKVIERAKGLLMKRAGLDEPSAFKRLQAKAREKSLRMADLAQSIVDADESFSS
ncbi:MAG: response regulator [Planctomycetota bacterium]